MAVNLAGSIDALESVMAAMSPETVLELPQTVAGTVEITLQNLGDQHGSIQIEITQALLVVDDVEGYKINLDPAVLLSVNADGVTGVASISSTLNTITALFPVDIDTFGNTVPGSLLLEGAEVTLNITDAGAGINAVVSIGPLDIDIAAANAVHFLLDPEVSINPDTEVITLDTALLLDFSITDTYSLFGDANGSLKVTAPSGTTFKEVSASVFKVQTGHVAFSGTGDFATMNLTVTAGGCFDIDGPVACPPI